MLAAHFTAHKDVDSMVFIVAEDCTGQQSGLKGPDLGPEVRDVEVHRSLDRTRTFLAFEADEPGSGKRALNLLSGRFEQVWLATLYEPSCTAARTAGGIVVVERSFAVPLEADEVQRREALGAWCLDLHGVQYLRTYFSLDRRRMICLYRAPDAEAVRIAQRTIGLPVDMVWATAAPDEFVSAVPRERLTLFDTALRDGVTGRSLADDRVLDLFSMLDDAGLDVIEVGLVGQSGAFSGPIAEARARIRSAVACCLAYPSVDAITTAAELLSTGERARMHVFNQVSDKRFVETGKTDLGESRLEEIRDTVSAARRLCGDVQWSAFDGTRADPDFLCRAFATAIAAGAGTVCLPDTSGHALPDEMAELVGLLLNKTVGIGDVTLSVHCHDNLGLAAANTLAAIGAGARQIEGTVGGIGPQGGNASLESVVGAVTARADRYRLGCGVELARLAPIAAELTALD